MEIIISLECVYFLFNFIIEVYLFITHGIFFFFRYNEETFNCYTFVLAFIRCLQNGPISEHAKSKIKFCELYVIPRATNAYKYVQLYRRLKDSGYFVNRPHNMNKFDF